MTSLWWQHGKPTKKVLANFKICWCVLAAAEILQSVSRQQGLRVPTVLWGAPSHKQARRRRPCPEPAGGMAHVTMVSLGVKKKEESRKCSVCFLELSDFNLNASCCKIMTLWVFVVLNLPSVKSESFGNASGPWTFDLNLGMITV